MKKLLLLAYGTLLAVAAQLCAEQPLDEFPLRALRQQLLDRDTATRQEAAKSLGRLGTEVRLVVSRLAGALEDPDEKVRYLAAEALGGIGPSAEFAIPALIRALDDSYVGVRVEASVALGYMAPLSKDAGPKLTELLKDRDREVRRKAMWALGQLGPYGKPGVPLLIEAVKTGVGVGGPPDESWHAMKALGNIGPEAAAAVPLLLELVKGKEESQRGAAVAALGFIGARSPEVVSALLGVLNDTRNPWNMRAGTAAALGRIGPDAKGAIPSLIQALHADWSSPPEVNLANGAASALGQMGAAGKPAVKPLMEVLNDPKANWDVRNRAAHALGDLGEVAKESIPSLVRLATSADKDSSAIHQGVRAALAQMGEAAVPALVEVLQHGDEYARTNALRLLCPLGPRAKAALKAVEAIGKNDPVYRDAARALKAIKARDP